MTVREIYHQLRATLVPQTLFVGVLVGFGALCLLGRQAARVTAHENFIRFTQYTSPETKYYPTVNEMMSIVRSKIKPGQVLVIVGGNSVLRGVAQLPDQLWSKRLQEQLGDDYCVVNLAFNSSLISDGASVVAEALRTEFPRQIYIANAAPGQAPTVGGSNVYRWIFWDAYYKGLLVKDESRAKLIEENIKKPPFNEGITELKMAAWLDGWCYFNDFWNDVTYQRFNTVWGTTTLGLTRFLEPRKIFKDPEPDGNAWTLETRYRPETTEVEMVNVRGCSIYAFNKDATTGQWVPYAPVWNNFTDALKNVFPPALRKRTLILMSGSSPYYLARLTEDERVRDKITYDMAVQKWKESGFDALAYGPDFAPIDYFDRTHLTGTGATKLAALVAPKVKAMAAELGYLDKK